MSQNEMLHLTYENFEQEALKSELPVLVDFWAPWCGPCRMVAPALEQLSKEMSGQLKIAKLNTDEFPEIAQQFRIVSIPTMILFDKGKILDMAIGALPKPEIKRFIDTALKAKELQKV